MKPSLSVEIAGIKFKNPVMTASGTSGYGTELSPYFDLSRLGAIVIKGTTLNPTDGNQPPRISETPNGLLNSIGLQNNGARYLVHNILPDVSKYNVPIIANICGAKVEDYVDVSKIIGNSSRVAALEINISCPNVSCGGMVFGTNPKLAFECINAVKKTTTLPIIAKLSPNVTDIVEIAKVCVDAGADALSLINTLTGMAVDIHTKKPKLGRIIGGLSGPAIKPIALRMVWQVANAVGVPVIGIGGISSVEDALEFLLVGAKAVQIGTASLANPRIFPSVIDGIEQFLISKHIDDINKYIGTLNF